MSTDPATTDNEFEDLYYLLEDSEEVPRPFPLLEHNWDPWRNDDGLVQAFFVKKIYGKGPYKKLVVPHLSATKTTADNGYDRIEFVKSEVANLMWRAGLAPVMRHYRDKYGDCGRRTVLDCLLHLVARSSSAGVWTGPLVFTISTKHLHRSLRSMCCRSLRWEKLESVLLDDAIQEPLGALHIKLSVADNTVTVDRSQTCPKAVKDACHG